MASEKASYDHMGADDRKRELELAMLREQVESMRLQNESLRQQIHERNMPETNKSSFCPDECLPPSAADILAHDIFSLVTNHPDFAEAVMDVVMGNANQCGEEKQCAENCPDCPKKSY